MTAVAERRIRRPSRWAAIYRRRSVLRLLVSRDLQIRYAGTFIGYLWTIIEPLLLSLIFWFIFGVVFKGRDVGADPYILYLLSGMLAWTWTNMSVGESTRALRSEAQLVRSMNIPREIWVLRIVGAKYVEYALSLAVLAAFMIGYGMPPTLWALAIPAAMIMQFLMLTGIGLILAPLTVLFKDLERLMRIVLRMFFYLTPVLYGVHNLPDSVQGVYLLNPMVGILEIYRGAIFPQWGVNLAAVGISAALSIGLLLVGTWVFRRTEGSALKEI